MTEAQLKEAIGLLQDLKTEHETAEIDETVNTKPTLIALELAVSILRSYLHALQSGEVKEFDKQAQKSDHFCPDCHEWYKKQMLSLIVARDRRIEELERREG